jgi:hypothetical protein
MKYKLIETEFATYVERTNEDGSITAIPSDPANSDYAEYLASLEATEPEAE